MLGSDLGTRLFTWMYGEEVGRDSQGNRYYRHRRGGHTHNDSLRKERRWVVYHGADEASRVPAEWHAWLHHTSDVIPPAEGPESYPWQRPHQANLTGTAGAYRPPGASVAGGKRARGTGDYEAWTPE